MISLNAASAHRLWAATYDEEPNPLLALEQRMLEPLLPDVHGRMVLDVASGTGRWARRLASMGARVIACDACFEMAVRGPRPAVISDAGRLPLPDQSADLTICAFALGYTGPCLAELARVTRTGGFVIVSDMHPDAARAGWTRSFRNGGKVISIAARRYDFDSLAAPGLREILRLETSFDEPERPLFAAAGRESRFEDCRRVPAIYIAKWFRDAD